MTDMELQGKSIEALKGFNNAIVMSKLYPPEAPQLANAVDRGYKSIKQYIREHGPLVFTAKDDNPLLCGIPLSEETLNSFANLVVYRQLRTLEMAKLAIGPEMDRFAFNQLLSLFNASVAKIKKEGGGTVYITSLGLASYFSEEDVKAPLPVVEEKRPKNVIRIRPELLDTLFGRNESASLYQEVVEQMAGAPAVDLLVAGTGAILKEISTGRKITVSPFFPVMLTHAEKLLGETRLQEIAGEVASVIADNLKEPALMVLLCQDFRGRFGALLYTSILRSISLDTFVEVISLMGERVGKLDSIPETSEQSEIIKKTIDELLATPKGRQHAGAETAKNMLVKGEKERRKKRLESGLQGLLQGNESVLRSEELLEYLPLAVQKMIKENAIDLIAAIVLRLVAASEEAPGRTASFGRAVVKVAERLFDNEHWYISVKLIEPMMRQVRQAKDMSPVIEDTLELLQMMMQKSWNLKEYEMGDSILVLFHRIRSGELRKSEQFMSVAGRIQDKGIQRALFPEFLNASLAAPTDDTLAYRLIYQGPIAIRFMVDALINAESEADRFKLMDMLTSGSGFVAGIVMERLPELMPWYGKRNLLKLLGETGGEMYAEQVLQYLRHDDFRVQKEALVCIYKIGGKNRKKLLLSALPDATELIKIKIIDLLGTMADQDVAGSLGELLEANHEISDKNRNDYLQKILETLGRCTFPSSLKSVEKFLASRGSKNARKISDQIWNIAEKIQKFLVADLHEVRKKHAQAGQLRKNALRQVAKISRTGKAERVITGLPQEQAVKALLGNGDKAGAVEQLLELIERTARQRNFGQSDQLREWLIEIDSSAYAEIIKAAEIIDAEKASAIDKGHLEIWNGLYDILSTEEFSAIYHSLIHRRYNNGEQIVAQGDVQSSLFFINSGRIRIYYAAKNGEIQLKALSQGEIFGADAFFEPSVWTVSAASVGTTEISILKLDRLNKWCSEYPGLEVRLRDFCRQFENIGELIKKDERERRSANRYNVSGILSASLVDDHDQKLGINTKGEISDISEGGISWLVKIPHKENSRLLLGRKVRLKLPVGENPGESLQLTGDILAVKSAWAVDNEYSVHVKFEQRLSLQELQDVISALRRELLEKQEK